LKHAIEVHFYVKGITDTNFLPYCRRHSKQPLEVALLAITTDQ